MPANQPEFVVLPAPFLNGGLPLTEAINQRRSIRDFSSEPVLLFQLSQVLWSAQGITDSLQNLRSVPSAGASYPLEIYVVVGDNAVREVDCGVYYYEVGMHRLSMHLQEDLRSALAEAALNQDSISVAPISLVICAEYDRTLARYSAKGESYIYMEAGHAGQNVYLQAVALGLGSLAIGAFRDDDVRRVLKLKSSMRPLCIMPVGKPG
jgi:SagB-type dehydrogenase family enzyme